MDDMGFFSGCFETYPKFPAPFSFPNSAKNIKKDRARCSYLRRKKFLFTF